MHASPTIAAAILGLALSAHAGVLVTQTLQDLEGQAPSVTNLIRLDKDKVRIDAGQNPDAYLIWRGDKHVLWSVDLKAKTYTETTAKDFEAMAAKRDAALVQLQDQIKDLPADQKKKMDAMLARMGVAAKPEYKKLGDGGKVGAWPTEKYEGDREGAKVAEVWTTAAGNVGMGDAEVKALKDMADLFSKFAKNVSGMLGGKDAGVDGVPVRIVGYKDGKPFWRSDVKETRREDLPDSLFEIPPGLAPRQVNKAG
jgi:hypothetical protein